MRIACINYEPVSAYRSQGWSCARLGSYYNPADVAAEVSVFAYGDRDWQVSPSVSVTGYSSLDELAARCKAFKPNVVRCYEAFRPNSDYALTIALASGVPSYVSLHDSRLQYHPDLAGYSVVTAYTESLAEQASRQLRRPVEVQLNGVDSDLFHPHVPTSIDRRVAGARYRVFTVSRPDAGNVKNLDTVLAATTLLARELESLAHVIAGPGTESIGFDGVHLGLGPTTEEMIAEYLNWCCCFLQVQLVGDLGMAAAEALMVGRPIIATGDSAGNARYHIDESRGLLVPIAKSRDTPFIADALYTCLYRHYDYAAIRGYALGIYDERNLRRREAERYTRLLSQKRPQAAASRLKAAGARLRLRYVKARAKARRVRRRFATPSALRHS